MNVHRISASTVILPVTTAYWLWSRGCKIRRALFLHFCAITNFPLGGFLQGSRLSFFKFFPIDLLNYYQTNYFSIIQFGYRYIKDSMYFHSKWKTLRECLPKVCHDYWFSKCSLHRLDRNAERLYQQTVQGVADQYQSLGDWYFF